jgi:hypothetical protein
MEAGSYRAADTASSASYNTDFIVKSLHDVLKI